MKFNIKLNNNLKEFSKLYVFLENVAESLKLDADFSIKLNLFYEEQVTNIIKYGYNDTNEHIIEIEIEYSNNTLICSVIDDGHFFNPLDNPEPDLDVPIEERKIGGLGILLIKKLSDNCYYERKDNLNIFTAEFIIPTTELINGNN